MKQWMVCAAMVAAGAVQADEAAVRSAVQGLVPGASIESVRPSAMKDVFEVVVNGEVLYVAADGSHLLQGRLFDTKQRSDLTAGTENSLRREVLAKVGDAAPGAARASPAPKTASARSKTTPAP